MTNIYEEVANAIYNQAVCDEKSAQFVAKIAVDLVLERLISDKVVVGNCTHAYYAVCDDGVYPRAIRAALKAAADTIRGNNG